MDPRETTLPPPETRHGEILRALLLRYLERGEPVSSRTLAQGSREQLSSASVRTVLADLEERGLISHPHPSAGGIPTDDALRLYARETLAGVRRDDAGVRDLAARLGAGAEGDAEGLARAAAGELARLSQQLALIMLPPLSRLRLRHLEFVPYEGRRVLAILAGDDGQVRHKMVETEGLLTAAELQTLANFLRAHCLGMTLAEAREFLARAHQHERERLDALTRAAARLGAEVFREPEGAELHLTGAAGLLARAAGEAGGESVPGLARAIEDKQKWLALLSRLAESESGRAPAPRVLLGDDLGPGVMSGLSVFSAPYYLDGAPAGALALVGPKRMEYARVCAQISTLAAALSAALTERRG